MLVKGFRRTNAQDYSLWRLGGKNWLTPAHNENKLGSKELMIFINTPGTY